MIAQRIRGVCTRSGVSCVCRVDGDWHFLFCLCFVLLCFSVRGESCSKRVLSCGLGRVGGLEIPEAAPQELESCAVAVLALKNVATLW